MTCPGRAEAFSLQMRGCYNAPCQNGADFKGALVEIPGKKKPVKGVILTGRNGPL